MGGVILFFLLVILIAIVIMPVVRGRLDQGRRRDDGAVSAHDAVISRLEDHRKRRNQPHDSSDG